MMMRTSPVSRVACSSRTVQQTSRPMVAVQAAKDAPKWQPIAMSVLASLMLSSAPVSAANTQSLANPSGDAPTSTALGNKYNVSNPTAPAGLTGENQSYPPESAKESVFGERGFIGAVEDKISGVTNSISNVGDKISNAASDAGSAGDDVKSSIKSVVSDVQNSTPSAGGAKASVSNALEDAKSSVSNTLNKAKNGISMAAPGANNPVEKAAAGAAKVQEVVSDNVKIARDDSNSAKNAKITVDQANRKVDQLFTGR